MLGWEGAEDGYTVPFMPCFVDVSIVTNGYNISMEEGGVGHSLYIRELDDSHVGHIFAMAPHTRLSRKFQPHLPFWSVILIHVPLNR